MQPTASLTHATLRFLHSLATVVGSASCMSSNAAAGAVQLAGVGIALSVYSTVTKLFNVPLLSVATSSVATAYGEHEGKHAASLLTRLACCVCR